MSIGKLFDRILTEWNRERDQHWRKIADRYARRSEMDGHVIRKTGDIVPRESV